MIGVIIYCSMLSFLLALTLISSVILVILILAAF